LSAQPEIEQRLAHVDGQVAVQLEAAGGGVVDDPAELVLLAQDAPELCDTLVPMAEPLDEAPENRQMMTEYPRRKPNPIVHLIRWLWRLFVIALIVFGIIALYLMLDEAWWYEVPILLVFGYFTYVLVRNRRRRVL
jgi:hypothetical protein